MYHQPTPEQLLNHFEYLERHYAFITLDALVETLYANTWDALSLPGVVVTIDDGKRSNRALLPLFRRYGVTPTFYVCSQLVGTNRRYWFDVGPEREHESLKQVHHEQRAARLREIDRFSLTTEYPESQRTALSHDEIGEMADLVDIQSHSRFHPTLTTCSDEDCHREIVCSRTEIEQLVGRSVRHFSFPHGDYGPRELRLVRAAGYRSARTVRIGWTGPRSDPYQLRVLGVEDDASVDQLAADMAGLGFLESALLRIARSLSSRSGISSSRYAQAISGPALCSSLRMLLWGRS